MSLRPDLSPSKKLSIFQHHSLEVVVLPVSFIVATTTSLTSSVLLRMVMLSTLGIARTEVSPTTAEQVSVKGR